MKQKRDKVFVWVTWLTKLISGEAQCEYVSWFKAHYKHDKVDSGNFDLAKWTINHNQLLHKRRDELEKKGYIVTIEDQNSFKLTLPKGITVSGKVDIVALSCPQLGIYHLDGLVEDCKTGKPKNSDQVQVMLYMLFLPKCIKKYEDVAFDGCVVYKDSEVPISSTDIDANLRNVVWDLIEKVGGDEPCRKVPSLDECKYCDISKKDCPERMELEGESAEVPSVSKEIGKTEQTFEKELLMIQSDDIRKFVIYCFEKFAADYFWTCPCSTSGKYHPAISLGEGGLIRHTKLAIWWGIELMRALPFELKHISTLQDEIIATLLLHDIRKNGKGLNEQGYPIEENVTATHGVLIADIIRSDIRAYLDNDDTYYRILTGIAGHMGVWTDEQYMEHRPNELQNDTQRAFAQLIHLADYCASRKVDEQFKMLKRIEEN